jgi:hypothetical protein
MIKNFNPRVLQQLKSGIKVSIYYFCILRFSKSQLLNDEKKYAIWV